MKVPIKIGDTTEAKLPVVSIAAVTIPTFEASTYGSSIGIVMILTINIDINIPIPATLIIRSISLAPNTDPKANKGKTPPEFMSTHPSPDNRIKKINEWMNDIIFKYPPINLS